MIQGLIGKVLTTLITKIIISAVKAIFKGWRDHKQSEENRETVNEIMEDDDRGRAADRLNAHLNGM